MKRFENIMFNESNHPQKKSILYSSIHMRFNNQQNQTMPKEIRTVVASGQSSGIHGMKENFLGGQKIFYILIRLLVMQMSTFIKLYI